MPWGIAGFAKPINKGLLCSLAPENKPQHVSVEAESRCGWDRTGFNAPECFFQFVRDFVADLGMFIKHTNILYLLCYTCLRASTLPHIWKISIHVRRLRCCTAVGSSLKIGPQRRVETQNTTIHTDTGQFSESLRSILRICQDSIVTAFNSSRKYIFGQPS